MTLRGSHERGLRTWRLDTEWWLRKTRWGGGWYPNALAAGMRERGSPGSETACSSAVRVGKVILWISHINHVRQGWRWPSGQVCFWRVSVARSKTHIITRSVIARFGTKSRLGLVFAAQEKDSVTSSPASMLIHANAPCKSH